MVGVSDRCGDVERTMLENGFAWSKEDMKALILCVN